MQIEQIPQPKKEAPAIWCWYVFLCVLLALLNVGLIIAGFWLLANDAEISRMAEAPPGSMQAYSLLYIAFGIFFGIGNLILPFLPKKPWTYVLHMTNIIAAGLTCILAPIAIPIFIYWLRPDAREYFDFR